MLVLNDNKIKKVNQIISNLRYIRVLFLHNNLIRKLPTEIGFLSDL
jgi:hypothetical protein